jgi:hypothetical protein
MQFVNSRPGHAVRRTKHLLLAPRFDQHAIQNSALKYNLKRVIGLDCN